MTDPDHPAAAAGPEPPAPPDSVQDAPADGARDDGLPGEGGLGATVAAISAADLEPAHRRRLIGQLVDHARRHRPARLLLHPRAGLRWMTDVVADLAPHVPVRDLDTLRRHLPGLDDDALADRLVRNAARATAGVGAAGGGFASMEWVATPTLLSAPVLLAAETIAVVAVELKLVGELHEVYGRPITGGAAQRATALLQAWAQQRGLNPLTTGAGVGTVLGTTARRDLQNTLLRRFGRNLTTFGPMLTGAAVGAYLNRRATRALGEKVQRDLRGATPSLP
ncbi:hypothetical protein [Krasilnikovia sp. MM14-A1259]|uniref:hypothetical protein n=1 Tax=Krasilnikovia sp. MM14-A1259 TaxID=3373539 RepID=UPI00382B7049